MWSTDLENKPYELADLWKIELTAFVNRLGC